MEEDETVAVVAAQEAAEEVVQTLSWAAVVYSQSKALTGRAAIVGADGRSMMLVEVDGSKAKEVVAKEGMMHMLMSLLPTSRRSRWR
mmetsp:Transcript_13768/g.32380  ORF Transcript_13768/g.32380 Transcript_13768/m.32380 type:complete len:87 (-) Transcript_13768:505-765(-)